MHACEHLRVGYIPYLNCVPFFHYLKDQGFAGTIVAGVPSALNRMLQNAEIHISPSSSFEYGQHYQDYLLLPEHSISANGPVKSVLLFSPCELDQLQDYKIAMTGESATSINLLRVLLREYVHLPHMVDYVPAESVESLIAAKQPALLIGDRAMKQALKLPAGMKCFDLGELWYRFTGLPFVYALWILRRDIVTELGSEITHLKKLISASLAQAFADLPQLAQKHAASQIEISALVAYWQTIDYSLTPKHLTGLDLYFRLCKKYGYLTETPAIEFFQG